MCLSANLGSVISVVTKGNVIVICVRSKEIKCVYSYIMPAEAVNTNGSEK